MKRIFLLSLFAVVVFSSCRFVEGQQLKGDGNITKEQRSITGFTGVETRGSIDIVVIPGEFKVVVESDHNIISSIVTEVDNNILVVHFKDTFHGYSYSTATVYVTAPALNTFNTRGSGNINGNGRFSGSNKTEISIGGSGDIKLELNSPVIDAGISGSGNITLVGETKDFSSEINGSGDMRAYELKAETVRMAVHGSGDTEVSASLKLDAEIYGSGDVSYKGRPQVSTSVHGSGSVSQVN